MRLVSRVSVSLVLLSALLRSNALGEITQLAGHSFVNGVVPDTVTNDLSISFTGQYSGSQLVIQLEAGSIFQQPQSGGGGDTPPYSVFFSIDGFQGSQFDTFVAQGGTTRDSNSSVGSPAMGAGAVNLGGEAGGQFDNEGISVHWIPAPGVQIIDRTDFLTARITLSSDARGSWSYLASADRVFGVVDSMPIENGRTTVALEGDYDGGGLVEQADLDLVLNHWGATALPPSWVNDLPDLEPGLGYRGIGQAELDGVLLKWGNAATDSWSMLPERVDPDETGGEVTGVWGDFNGSGQVEQADLDLLLLNWAAPIEPVPEGWVNDLPDPPLIDGQELDRVLLNWGDRLTAVPVLLSIPEPLGLLPLGIALLLVHWRLRRSVA